MPEKFDPIIEKLAKSHGLEGGYTVPTMHKRASQNPDRKAFEAKETIAKKNLRKDEYEDKYSDGEEWKSAPESVEESDEDEDEEEVEPRGFLGESLEEKRKQVLEMAGLNEFFNLKKQIYQKLGRLEFDKAKLDPYEREAEIDKTRAEKIIVEQIMAVLSELSENDADLVKKLEEQLDLLLRKVIERINLSPDQKEQIEIYDQHIDELRSFIHQKIAERKIGRDRK